MVVVMAVTFLVAVAAVQVKQVVLARLETAVMVRLVLSQVHL
jgi:hypothetical protein